MEPLNEDNELKRQAPTLFGLPKVDPFVVPSGFFEQFPHDAQARVTERSRTRDRGWFKRMAIALPVVALGLGAFWWLRPGVIVDPPIVEVQLPAISDEDLDDLDDSELQSLAEGTTDNATSDLGAVALDLNDDELLTYLQHENTDLDELITDL